MVNFQNEGYGALGDPTGAPKDQKWPKLTKILIFDFATIHFTQVKQISLLLHLSNAESVVEKERREWRSLGAQQEGPKGLKTAKIDQNHEFILFYSHPIHSGYKYSLFLHWS